MEITSFVLGVCVVILLLMITGTSVNYKTTKVLRGDLDYLESESQRSFMDTNRDIERLRYDFREHQRNLTSYVDSRVDKLNHTLEDIIKEQEITINYNREQIKSLSLNIESLVKEIKKVETGYKEKINY